MSVILLVALTSYIVIAVIFNVLMLSFYKEEKGLTETRWTGDETADKIGMFMASAFWPICVAYGLYKIYFKKEDK